MPRTAPLLQPQLLRALDAASTPKRSIVLLGETLADAFGWRYTAAWEEPSRGGRTALQLPPPPPHAATSLERPARSHITCTAGVSHVLLPVQSARRLLAWMAFDAPPEAPPTPERLEDAEAATAVLALTLERLWQRERVTQARQRRALARWEWDLTRRRLFFSPEAMHLMGYPRRARFLTAEQLAAWINPDDLLLFQHRTIAALDAGAGYTLNFRARGRDGVERHFVTQVILTLSNAGEPKRLLGAIAQDSDPPRANPVLPNGLTQTLQHLTAPLLVHSELGVPLFANSAACRAFGRTLDELKEHPTEALFPDLDAWRELKDLFIEGGILRQGREVPISGPQGSLLRLRCVTIPLPEVEGHRVNLIGFYGAESAGHLQSHPATSRETGLLNEHLEQLLYVAAHDLRTPLISVQGFTTELEHATRALQSIFDSGEDLAPRRRQLEWLLKEDLPESVQHIQRSTRHMEFILKGLMELVRIGSAPLHLQQLDMDRLLHSIQHELQDTLETRRAHMECDPLPAAYGDTSLVRRLFASLLANAIQYLHPQREGRIQLAGVREGDTCVYFIRDNGIGISSYEQRHVFRRFYRASSSGSDDRGLGLTIARSIARRHGGDVWLESVSDIGTTLFIRLPAPPA